MTPSEAKQDGMRRADAHASAAWVGKADAAIHTLAQERYTFTADAVWGKIGEGGTHDGRALGPRMLAAAKLGWIRKGGTVLSTREKRHQAPIQVWVSCLKKGKVEIPRWTDDLLRMDQDARYALLQAVGVLDREGSFAWD